MTSATPANPLLLNVGGTLASAGRAGSKRFAIGGAPAMVVPSIMILSDSFAVLLAAAISLIGRYLVDGQLDPMLYARLWPLAFFFVCSNAAMGLYTATAVHHVEELRRLTISTSMVFLLLGGMTFAIRGLESYSRIYFATTWLITLCAMPLSRYLVKAAFAHKNWWGYPAFVIGSGPQAENVIRSFRAQPAMGIKPVAVFDYCRAAKAEVAGLPVLGDIDLARDLAEHTGVRYAIIASPELSRPELSQMITQYSQVFTHLLVIPEFLGFSSLWVDPIEVGSFLGLEVRQRLLLPSSRIAKTLIDGFVTLLGGVVILPLIALIAVAIRLTSKGPAFYCQGRVGKGGLHFKAWKFRTMCLRSEEVLQEWLAKDPDLRQEWERNFKLKNDPRVTRVGRFLRNTSLDELPQLWNVLRAEMSLVGPRPIVAAEGERYGDELSLLARVKPGISGLWQVSGRSDTSYQDRVRLDMYYIRNWSVWLDIFILAKTCAVVLRRQGAY
jgi:Undecaprenyl-phosphate galactose phosphotransferase WbaP